jgi:hypothetical protein
MDFLIWLENTAVAQAIASSRWMFPALESMHYVGIALLVGGIMVIDLRVLGFARRLPLEPVMSLLPWVFVGFLINVVTGSLMLTYGATSFGTNTMFWYKMGLMFLAGLNALLFKVVSTRAGAEWLATEIVPGSLKALAAASLVLWLGVTTAGRFMAYVY